MAGKNVSRIDNRSCKWQSSQRAGLNRFKPVLVNQLSIIPKLVNQTSVNWGPDSRFVLKAIIKALISKSSRSSKLKTPNRLHPIHDFQPNLSLPEYLNFHTCLHDYQHLFCSKCGCVNSNTWLLFNVVFDLE